MKFLDLHPPGKTEMASLLFRWICLACIAYCVVGMFLRLIKNASGGEIRDCLTRFRYLKTNKLSTCMRFATACVISLARNVILRQSIIIMLRYRLAPAVPTISGDFLLGRAAIRSAMCLVNFEALVESSYASLTTVLLT